MTPPSTRRKPRRQQPEQQQLSQASAALPRATSLRRASRCVGHWSHTPPPASAPLSAERTSPSGPARPSRRYGARVVANKPPATSAPGSSTTTTTLAFAENDPANRPGFSCASDGEQGITSNLRPLQVSGQPGIPEVPVWGNPAPAYSSVTLTSLASACSKTVRRSGTRGSARRSEGRRRARTGPIGSGR